MKDWINLLEDKANWTLVQRAEAKLNATFEIVGQEMKVKGGDVLAAVVYTGKNGPPHNISAKCPGTEIEFRYKFVTSEEFPGINSGFHYSIPSSAMSGVDEIVAQAYEVQLGTPAMYDQNKSKLESYRKALEKAIASGNADRQKLIEELIAKELSTLPGGIYEQVGGAPHTPPELDPEWNSVRIVLDKPDGSNNLRTTVSINRVEVTRFLSNDVERGHGGIGFQAYMATEIHFKDVRWRKMDE